MAKKTLTIFNDKNFQFYDTKQKYLWYNAFMKNIVIYTDGACSCNPGPGGWGAILMYKDTKKEISGYNPMTTNNQMELTAVIEALLLLREPCKVSLFSDSAYVVNAFLQDWVSSWVLNGWRNANKKDVKKSYILLFHHK